MESCKPINIYNSVDLLGLRLDFPSDEALQDYAVSAELRRNRQICCVNLRKFLQARRGGEYGSTVAGADIVLPTASALAAAATRAGARHARHYDDVHVLVTLLSSLERRSGSIFLVGATPAIIAKAEVNIKATFPELRIVGRYAGPWSQNDEKAALEAIRKSTPDLLLAGSRLPGGELWISRHLPEFSSGLYFWGSDILETLAGKARRHRRYHAAPDATSQGTKMPWYKFLSPAHFFAFCSLRVIQFFYKSPANKG